MPKLNSRDDKIQQLEQAKLDCAAALNDAIVAWRGAQEFRNAVEELLCGTPYQRPTDHDHEGLYGRLRNALRDGVKVA